MDTEKYTVRLKAVADGKATMIRREGGKVERQYRYMCGELPVCYKSEEGGRYLYIIDGALTAFNHAGGKGKKRAGEASADDEPPPSARSGHSATLVGGYVVVFGGTQGKHFHADTVVLDARALSDVKRVGN